MDSCAVIMGMGFKGLVSGITGSPNLKAKVGRVLRCDFSSTEKMVYDAAEDGYELSIAASTTTTLDLSTGLSSPLNESITGDLDFSGGVYCVMIVHDPDSLATDGITVFGGGVDEFQGPWAAGDKATLNPGQGVGFITQANKTGWTMSAAGARKIAITNLDAGDAATVWAFVMGKV